MKTETTETTGKQALEEARRILDEDKELLFSCKYLRDEYLWLVVCKWENQYVVWMYNVYDCSFFGGRYFDNYGQALCCFIDRCESTTLLDIANIQQGSTLSPKL